MSSTEATQSNEYALVSSFYGPGAVGGWYLTVLACLISFSLHPRKRTRDSITADLIAVLTFPTVAAADLITQVRSYPPEGTASAQNAASIDATLIITETFFAIDVVLFLLAVGYKCTRRGSLLATVGLFCSSAEWYMYFSFFVSPTIWQQRDRVFLINFGRILVVFMALLMTCVTPALGLVALFLSMPPRLPHTRPSEQAMEPTHRDWELDFKRSHNAKWLTIITQVFGTCIFVASVSPLFLGAMMNLPSQFWPLIRTAASRIAHGLTPTSNTSVKELDQAVALLAGATVLGFCLYSTVDTYYQAWLSKTRAMT